MARKKLIRLLPILVTLLAMAVLTVGSFYGCASNFLNRPTRFAQICFYAFFVFATGFMVAIIWLLVAIVLNLSRRKDDGQ